MGNPQRPQPNQPNAAQAGQGGGQAQARISPMQVLASIEEEATTGFCILTTMMMVRLQFDREGASREDRKALLDFWQDSYVDQHVDQWKERLNNAQNRMAAMQQGSTLDQLLERLDKVPQELRQKFGTFILAGANDPVDSLEECVEQFKALQEEANRQTQNADGAVT